MLLDEETAHAGITCISAETQAYLAELDIPSFIDAHFGDFLRHVRFLDAEDQEIVLGYYLLQKTQATLAVLHASTQTLTGARVRMAMQKIGTSLVLGIPTPKLLAELFMEIGMEDTLDKPLSEVVDLYRRSRSFQRCAEVTGLRRQTLRRAIIDATAALNRSTDSRQQALGVYMSDLINKADAKHSGVTAQERAKQAHILFSDPKVLGEFRIDVEDPGFDSLFTSRAIR
jgi:hypothetical protein